MKPAEWRYIGETVLGMSNRDLTRSTPGIIFDMLELHKQRTQRG